MSADLSLIQRLTLSGVTKEAFVPAPPAAGAGMPAPAPMPPMAPPPSPQPGAMPQMPQMPPAGAMPPVDPAMLAGMGVDPGMLAQMGIDPAMLGGGMPPDPNAGMPVAPLSPSTTMGEDPASAGGMPQAEQQGLSPEIQDAIQLAVEQALAQANAGEDPQSRVQMQAKLDEAMARISDLENTIAMLADGTGAANVMEQPGAVAGMADIPVDGGEPPITQEDLPPGMLPPVDLGFGAESPKLASDRRHHWGIGAGTYER